MAIGRTLPKGLAAATGRIRRSYRHDVGTGAINVVQLFQPLEQDLQVNWPFDLHHSENLIEKLARKVSLEEVRALLGHARIDTTQVSTSIKPSQLSSPWCKSVRDP